MTRARSGAEAPGQPQAGGRSRKGPSQSRADDDRRLPGGGAAHLDHLPVRRVLHIIAWMHARLGARPLFGTFGILQALDRAGAGYGTHKVTVCAGDRVLLDTRAAKHDPAVFPRPDRFDITRHGRAHLSFGHGARYALRPDRTAGGVLSAAGAPFTRCGSQPRPGSFGCVPVR